jgi:hypothetical protein
MKKLIWAVALGLAIAACGGEDGGGEEDTGGAADVSSETTAADTGMAGDVAGREETVDGPVVPVPANPLPTPDAGTYSWTDGDNRISFAYNNGKIFVLESSFGCVGDTGCKVKQDFLKLTCNTAFEKGYHGDTIDGAFTITGLKKTDTLHGAMKSTTSFDLLYELTPTMECCTDYFAFTATWDNTESCSDYAQPDCDPYSDENCADGMNCIFGAGNKPACSVAGETPAGKQCSTQGNCADGVCMGLEGVEGQYCYKYCKSVNDCDYGTKCLELTGQPYNVCSLSADEFETCNLLQQSCEGAADGCYWSVSTINQPVCSKAGEGGGGDPCTSGTDCQKGFDCIANKECRKICNLTEGQEPTCDSVFTGCSNYYGPQNAGYCGE